jgi:homoprotocatechuate degradation regulator HpaR
MADSRAMTEQNIPRKLYRTSRSLPIALLRAREAVMGPLREMLADSPVNEQKWRVLRVLEEAGPQDQNSIAKQACLLLPSLTRILRVMEEDGLVSRQADEDDRRRSIVTIEAPGLKVLESHAEKASLLVEQLRAKYGEDKFEKLLDLLEDLQSVNAKN